MDITQMKKKDFEAVPAYSDENRPQTFNSIVIIPQRCLHNSGWACMTYVLCKGGKPICKIESGSDALHLDGIGGYGHWYLGDIPDKVKPKGWVIDCLPCGYIRIHAHKNLYLEDNVWASDVEIYCE